MSSKANPHILLSKISHSLRAYKISLTIELKHAQKFIQNRLNSTGTFQMRTFNTNNMEIIRNIEYLDCKNVSIIMVKDYAFKISGENSWIDNRELHLGQIQFYQIDFNLSLHVVFVHEK